ncbi:MAG: glycosyltransferase family 4 protein [Nitrospirota bacterium]
MNILFFTPAFLPTVGGAELMLHNLAASLVVRGHNITVLAPEVRHKDNDVECNYRLVRYQKPSSKRFGVRQTLFYLFRERLKTTIDVLHCHGAYPTGFVGASFKSLFKVPLVIRPHGSDILPGEGIRKNKRLEGRLVSALKRADAVVAQSLELKEIISGLGVAEKNIRIIPNGVDAVKYKNFNPNSKFRQPYALALGSLTWKKGFDILIKAFHAVSMEASDLKLYIAGAGPEEENLHRLADRLGLKEKIIFTGIISGQEKLDALSGCLFGVSSSRREPFSNSNLEFMAVGKPLAAAAVGGNIEVVKDGVNGILVDKENINELADAMLKLVLDDSLRERMGNAASEEVQKYDWNKVVDRYEELYSSLIGKQI